MANGSNLTSAKSMGRQIAEQQSSVDQIRLPKAESLRKDKNSSKSQSFAAKLDQLTLPKSTNRGNNLSRLGKLARSINGVEKALNSGNIDAALDNFRLAAAYHSISTKQTAQPERHTAVDALNQKIIEVGSKLMPQLKESAIKNPLDCDDKLELIEFINSISGNNRLHGIEDILQQVAAAVREKRGLEKTPDLS